LTDADAAERIAESSDYDPYRRDLPPAVASQPIWPLMVLLASCLFVGDVFVRRVQVGFGWVAPLASRVRAALFGGEPVEPKAETMQRLRSRKAEVRESTTAAGATRFESTDEAAPATASPLDDLKRPAGAPSKKPAATKTDQIASEEKPQEEGYTSRLLKAKRGALGDREKDK